MLRHCRFYLDPAELQTLFYDSHNHYGYFRDDSDSPPIVVSNTNSAAPAAWAKITPIADNLLAALE